MGKILRKRQKKLMQRRNAHSLILKNLPSNVNPAAFKTPGSMNRKKTS
jgi:hypothetical protein